jgi:adenylyltransferase/sulfurtransferase
MGVGIETDVEALKSLIASKERELAHLKKRLVEAEEEEKRASEQTQQTSWKWPLRAEEYDRYGRQLILPGFGTEG